MARRLCTLPPACCCPLCCPAAALSMPPGTLTRKRQQGPPNAPAFHCEMLSHISLYPSLQGLSPSPCQPRFSNISLLLQWLAAACAVAPSWFRCCNCCRANDVTYSWRLLAGQGTGSALGCCAVMPGYMLQCLACFDACNQKDSFASSHRLWLAAAGCCRVSLAAVGRQPAAYTPAPVVAFTLASHACHSIRSPGRRCAREGRNDSMLNQQPLRAASSVKRYKRHVQTVIQCSKRGCGRESDCQLRWHLW